MRYAIISVVLALSASPGLASETCDVAEVYQVVDAPQGAAALTVSGEIEEVLTLLAPANLEPGDYEVTVSRKARNIYTVLGYQLYIVTRRCYVYGYSEEAVLRVQSRYGYRRGELIFLD